MPSDTDLAKGADLFLKARSKLWQDSNDDNIKLVVNIANLTDANLPGYHVLSLAGRIPLLINLLQSLNKGLSNSYTMLDYHPDYQEFQEDKDKTSIYIGVMALVKDYCCWHYPTIEKLHFLVNFIAGRRVLELGCGQGMLSALLLGCGVDLVATDSGEWIDHKNGSGIPFTSYHKLNSEDAIQRYSSNPSYPDYCPILLACWNIVEIDWDKFAGDDAIIIGNHNSCYGYPNPDHWELVGSLAGEQWRAHHSLKNFGACYPDTINCYHRKKI